jgi:hypothetical protein
LLFNFALSDLRNANLIAIHCIRSLNRVFPNHCVDYILVGLRHQQTTPPPYRRNWRGMLGLPLRLTGMAEIVNLRIARKRAARSKAEAQAAEQRLAHGASKSERDQAAADRAKARQILDQHQIETGDRR